MLEIHIPDQELWDELNEQFVTVSGGTFQFEHSLKAIADWESKWCKSFFKGDKTPEESIDYMRKMCIGRHLPEHLLTTEVQSKLVEHMNKKHTATTVGSSEGSRKTLTSEVIYAYMALGQVPFECELWNIERLLMLLAVISELQSPTKKMSAKESAQKYRDLNKERREKMNSAG